MLCAYSDENPGLGTTDLQYTISIAPFLLAYILFEGKWIKNVFPNKANMNYEAEFKFCINFCNKIWALDI